MRRNLLWVLVLPETKDDPAEGYEELVVLPVSAHVAAELGLPKRGVRRGHRRVLRAAMPEAPVDEHGDTPLREDDVRPGGCPPARDPVVDSVPEACTMKQRANGQLWARVAAAVRRQRCGAYAHPSDDNRLPGASAAQSRLPCVDAAPSTLDRPSFRFAELFAGIGGMRLGLERLGGRCVFAVEWDRFARATYEANFAGGSHRAYWGDVRDLDALDVPSHDILAAGFPCQPFSLAGVSKKRSLGRAHGFDDATQGTLFFEVLRILREHRPQGFLLENVKNLLSHDRGRTLAIILASLRDAGYDVAKPLIGDARAFVPQKRERVFLLGVRSDLGCTLRAASVPAVGDGPRMSAVLHPEDGSEMPESPFTSGPDARVAAKYTLSDNLWAYLRNYAAKHRAAGNGFGFGLVGPDDTARTLSARYHKDGAEILVDQRGRNPRRLTPREAARLMGFTVPGRGVAASQWVIPVSDTQAYRQFGNAVVPAVVEAVARPLITALARSGAGDGDVRTDGLCPASQIVGAVQ